MKGIVLSYQINNLMSKTKENVILKIQPRMLMETVS